MHVSSARLASGPRITVLYAPVTKEKQGETKARRVHVIACSVLALDLKKAAQDLDLDISTDFRPGGLHNRPLELRERLQEAIDAASSAALYDLIVVGYGICGRGTIGIHARNIPLAIPRVHDCIALFLGSDGAYRREFSKYPGTYYISAGWVEGRTDPQPSSGDNGKSSSPIWVEYEQLRKKHGSDHADAVRDFLTSWQRNYQRAAFIDTGTEGRRRYAKIAKEMAKSFGWRYEELHGTHDLLARLLTAVETSDEVLIVPPQQVTTYDAAQKRILARPKTKGAVSATVDAAPPLSRPVLATETIPETAESHLGLGIDAGGTYTDAVIYDFHAQKVIQKAKAPTTRWDFSLGIAEAVGQLDAEYLERVSLVSISTTLATNAIVEGRGQKVGILLMPPYGLFDSSRFNHRPIAVIDGQMEIDGSEIAPVNPDQVRRAVDDMLEREAVGAFAVAGYASHSNPSHELQVREIIRERTTLSVTCGHDVSDGLNYRIRAETAALNARIIPCLESLLTKVGDVLRRVGIRAVTMVVRSDGSLMGLETALQRPVETILSGPAASAAGGSFLAGVKDALIVDIGGTTTDTALIRKGIVQTCEDGATVGGWKTHVRALDMRTLGLGGDSLVLGVSGKFEIGPRRVAPVSWLVAHHPESRAALDWIERHVDAFAGSTRDMEILLMPRRVSRDELNEKETRVLDALSDRPYCLAELSKVTGASAPRFLPLDRLTERNLVQRCGLTPTDLLHAVGELDLWDVDCATRLCRAVGRVSGLMGQEWIPSVLRRMAERLAVEILKKQLADEVDPDDIESSPGAAALLQNLLNGGNEDYRVQIELHRPIVGIGAPVRFFLPEAAKLLKTRAVIPEHADVANAVGAVTSSIFVRKQVDIAVDETGEYIVRGLPDAPKFTTLSAAQQFAAKQLTAAVTESARRSGARQPEVEIISRDQVATLSDGAELFLGRTIEARAVAHPDLL